MVLECGVSYINRNVLEVYMVELVVMKWCKGTAEKKVQGCDEERQKGWVKETHIMVLLNGYKW